MTAHTPLRPESSGADPSLPRPATWVPVAKDAIGEHWQAVALWAVALVAIAAMYIAFYPSFGGGEMDELVDNLPEALVTALGYDRIGTAAGYVNASVYALLGPALLGVFSVTRGASLTAGDEELGVLELDLTAPVTRRQLLAGRLIALWSSLAALAGALGLTTLAMVRGLDLDITSSNIAAATLGLLLFAIAIGSVTAATGAVTGRRAISLGVGAAVTVASFVLNAIGPTVEAGWMTAISPMSWYVGDDPLENGVDPAGFGALVALSVVVTAVGFAVYDRRDLMT